MSEPDPFVKKNPGDIILASDWNQMQVRAREAIDLAIASHRHTGAERDGPKLTGSALDTGSDLTAKSLTVTERLTIAAPKEAQAAAGYSLQISSRTGERQNALAISADAGLRGHDALTLMRFGNDGDYQLLHKASGFYGRNTLALHCGSDDAIGLYSSSWTPLLEVAGGSGNTYVRGRLELGNSDLYFTNTDHDHTGFGNTKGYAAIENAKNHDALMILGRAGTDKGRLVKLWDYLEINGKLSVTDDILMASSKTIRGAGRLHITGEELLYVLNKNGMVIGKEWGGNGNLTVQGDLLVTGRIGSYGKPATPLTPGWGGGLRTWDIEAEGSIWTKNAVNTGKRDLAEIYGSHQQLHPGDVVSLARDNEEIIHASGPGDPCVIGVISTDPGVLLNSQFNRDHVLADGCTPYPVALCGRVPCKVTDENGPIRRGDLLTCATKPGFAMRADTDARGGSIIGKALQPHAEGGGVIEIFVMLQ